MEALEYVRPYIDNLLVITRGTLEDHLEEQREVLRRLHKAGLKVNAVKSFFCTHEIEYLGYILTRGGIKPQQKKVQAIGDTHAKSAKQCQGVTTLLRNGTILP
jgi:hypothetical protein